MRARKATSCTLAAVLACSIAVPAPLLANEIPQDSGVSAAQVESLVASDAATEPGESDASLEESSGSELVISDGETISASCTIDSGGTFYLPASEDAGDAAITVTVDTCDQVVIVGNGYDPAGSDGAPSACNVQFVAGQAGVNLTFQDVYLSTEAGLSLIDLTGEANTVMFEGTSCLHAVSSGSSTGSAMIHVGKGCSANIAGSGTLYLYGSLSAACIGAKAGEVNGTISFGMEGESPENSLTLFAMNRANDSKGSPKSGTGPIIGTSASTADAAGAITFYSGTYYLSRSNDGSAIQTPSGQASSSANVVLAGANVYVVQNHQCSNLSKSGWSHTIGAAKEVVGNARGTFTYLSGSLLAYVTTLGGYSGCLGFDDAAYLPGITDAPLNLLRQSESGTALVPCYIDTAGLESAGSSTYYVYLDDEPDPLYVGGLAQYSVEETPVYPSLKWVASEQSMLCFYLTPGSHTLTIYGDEASDTVGLTWNAQEGSFDITGVAPVAHTYSIGYNLSGGKNSDANPASYSSGMEDDIVLADPTREGYAFTGWTDMDGNPATGITAGTTGYQEFTANWEALECSVSYRDASGVTQVLSTDYGTTLVVDGVKTTITGAIALSDNPDAGYLHRVYTLQSQTDTQLVLTSQSQGLASYQIGYQLGGGTNDPRNADAYTIESGEITLYDPTREGYSFDGWLYEGKVVTAIPAGSTGDRELAAQWSENALRVSYTAADGGTASALLAAGRTVYVDGVAFAPASAGLSVPDPAAREGWATAGYEAQLDSRGNLWLTSAYSDPLGYTITYDLDEGQAGGAYPETYQSDSPDIALANPTRAGFAFAGFVDAQGKMVSTRNADGTLSTTIASGTTGNLYLKATWTQDYKQLSYLGTNGATCFSTLPGGSAYTKATIVALDGSQASFDISEYSGSRVLSIPNPKSSKLGYGLVAYVLEADAVSGTLTFTETPCMPIAYRISYELAGGTGAGENPLSYTAETPDIILTDPTREGYAFTGWRDAQGRAVETIAKGTTGDIVLTATWEALPCQVSYLTPEGKVAVIEIAYDASYSIDGGAAAKVKGDVRIPDPTGDPNEGYLCVGYEAVKDAQGNVSFTRRSGRPQQCVVSIDTPLDLSRVKSDGSYYRKAAITVRVDGQEISSGTAVPNGTVVELAVYPLDGYVLDAFTVNGVSLEAGTYQVEIDSDTVISAALHDTSTRSCVAQIVDESAGKVSYSITKTGIVYVDGKPQWVVDKVVEDGDEIYEEDVLTLTASLVDGAQPDDPDMTYLDDDGAQSPCRFMVNGRSTAVEAPGKYVVSASELKMMGEGTLSIRVLCPKETQKSWLQVADTSWYDAENPQSSYTLSTPEQLAGMVRLMNNGITQFSQTTIRLARDISLANNDGTSGRRLWIPSDYDGSVQNMTAAFKGTFDGAGHTISGLDILVQDNMGRMYNALFSAAYDATFKDLTIEGSVDTVTQAAAGLVAFASDCVIQNVTNRATVRGCNEFAGIVAILTGVNEPRITGCRNEGTVAYGYNSQNSQGSCGGIVANINEVSVVEDCVNTGEVSSNVNDGFAAGIVGHAGGSGSKVSEVAISNCRNYGSVTVRTNANSSSASHIGGIVGFGPCTITRCVNYGAVANTSTSALQTAEVGGIIGAPTGATVIKYCANCGDVSLSGGAVVRIGGIAGWYDGGGTLMYCVNQGTVNAGDALAGKGVPAEYAKASGAGGLVGLASENGTDLFYSYNAGAVVGDSPAANPLAGSAIGVAYGTIHLINVLCLTGTAAGSYGTLTGKGALSGEDARQVSAAQLAASASALNQGTDKQAFLDDILGANGGYPILTWMATRTVSFVNDDGALLAKVAVPESYAASVGDVAAHYAAAYGTPLASGMPQGCTQVTFCRWDNLTSGQDAESVSAASGDMTLRAVYAYDNDTYSIIYHVNGGTLLGVANPATYRSALGVASFAAPWGDEGEFLAWKDAQGVVVTQIAPGETGDRDLYAAWDRYVSPATLQGEVSYARQLLDANVESADGTDVVCTRNWASAAQRALLEDAIEQAQAVCSYPFLTQSASDAAQQALQEAAKTFESQLKPGTWKCAITQQPADASALKEALVSFSVAVNDADAVKSYEWQYSTDGQNWNNAKNYVKSDGSGFATAQLSFKMYQAYDANLWRCKVVFKDGTTAYSQSAKSSLAQAEDPTPTPVSPDPGSSTPLTDEGSGTALSLASLASSTASAQQKSTAEVDTEALYGYANGTAAAQRTRFSLGVLGWSVIVAGAAFILGFGRSVRKSHKYDKRLDKWM